MKIIYVEGDLLKAKEACLLQQVNARGVMGSGVAKAIMRRYPLVYAVYRTEYMARGLPMGSVVWVDCGVENPKNHLIGNIVGQPDFGGDGKVYTDYEALRVGFKEANRFLVESGITAAALPLIGAGLGGGDWGKIAEIIETEMVTVQPIVYVLDKSLIP